MNNIDKLDAKLKTLQDEGVVAVRLYRAGERTSMDDVAKGVLDLMEAETVPDNEIF